MMWFDAHVKKIYEIFILLFKTHLFKMRLNAAERESIRKRLFFYKKH